MLDWFSVGEYVGYTHTYVHAYIHIHIHVYTPSRVYTCSHMISYTHICRRIFKPWSIAVAFRGLSPKCIGMCLLSFELTVCVQLRQCVYEGWSPFFMHGLIHMECLFVVGNIAYLSRRILRASNLKPHLRRKTHTHTHMIMNHRTRDRGRHPLGTGHPPLGETAGNASARLAQLTSRISGDSTT